MNESGCAVHALLPKKDERYRRRGIKVEPKWLGEKESFSHFLDHERHTRTPRVNQVTEL